MEFESDLYGCASGVYLQTYHVIPLPNTQHSFSSSTGANCGDTVIQACQSGCGGGRAQRLLSYWTLCHCPQQGPRSQLMEVGAILSRFQCLCLCLC